MVRSPMARWYTFVALSFVLVAGFPASSVLAQSGHVLPPNARPKGYSLAEAARKTAFFNTGSHAADRYPLGLPFQILYVKPGSTGSSAFTVGPETMFYVPMQYFDDTPPVGGTFPTTSAGARHYVFDPSQFGARDLRIVVDGSTTPIGPGYVAGPVTTPLADGLGTPYLAVAAFITPLAVGTHNIQLHAEFAGALAGGDFIWDYTYVVTVHGDS